MKVNSILNSSAGQDLLAVAFKLGRAKALAQIISRKVIPYNTKGFTFDPRLERCLALGPNTNPAIFVVSMAGHEQKVPRIPTEGDLTWWIFARLELLRSEGKYIGGWPYLGDYYLDISVLVRGRAAAMAFAVANGQRAVYHPASGGSEDVKPDEFDPPSPSVPVSRPRTPPPASPKEALCLGNSK